MLFLLKKEKRIVGGVRDGEGSFAPSLPFVVVVVGQRGGEGGGCNVMLARVKSF